MKYFNCHAHSFNMQYVPENFLRVHMSDKVAGALHWLLNQKGISKILLWGAKKIIRKGTTAKTLAFLTIGLKKTQDMVFEDLISNYPEGDEVKFIILPLDFKFMGAGDLPIPYEQQLEDLFEVKLKYPDQCYPFVAIDPRRGSAMDNMLFVKKYIDRGFSGIKLYPALGYFSFDQGLEQVFKYAEQNNIPLMTHCSTGGINYVGKTAPDDFVHPKAFYKIPGKVYDFPQDKKEISLYCDQFNNPGNFQEALIKFPNLKICLAHMGLNASNKMGPKVINKDVPVLEWFNTVIELMKQYPKVYTDISYSVAYDGFCKWFKELYNGWPPEIQERIMFGTDYFMTVQEEHGNDNQILKVCLRDFGEDMFTKLAYTNTVNYLKHSGGN